MQPDEQGRALFEAIREAPEDDAPRLIYADWLDDQGDSVRAEFIRIQCELARLGPADERRLDLAPRAAQLLEANRDAWLGPLAKALRTDQCVFRRGFPEDLAIRPKAVVSLAEEIDRCVPAGRLKLYGAFGEPAFAAFLACANLGWVTGLWLESARIDESGLPGIAASPNLPNLTELTLQYASYTAAGVRALAHSLHRHGLRRLSLNHTIWGSVGSHLVPVGTAEVLAGPVTFRLRFLSLHGNRIGAEETVSLANAPHLKDLDALDLLHNNLDDEGALALARSPVLRGLSLLNLQNNGLTTRAAVELARSPLLDGIVSLNLGVSEIGDEGAEALAASPLLHRLTHLGLFRAGLTDRGAIALASSPHLSNLTDLELTTNALTDRGSQALFDSPHLRHLQAIGIGGTFVAEKIISPVQRKQWQKRLGKGARV